MTGIHAALMSATALMLLLKVLVISAMPSIFALMPKTIGRFASRVAWSFPTMFASALAAALITSVISGGVHLAEHVPLQLPSAWMPLPPAAPPALQVPSHLPSQSTETPPLAVQVPEHLPVQEPVQATVAEPSALHSPLHETSSLPPVHFGGVALISHFAEPENFALQFAFALPRA